jgi:hypothetical protein
VRVLCVSAVVCLLACWTSSSTAQQPALPNTFTLTVGPDTFGNSQAPALHGTVAMGKAGNGWSGNGPGGTVWTINPIGGTAWNLSVSRAGKTLGANTPLTVSGTSITWRVGADGGAVTVVK